MKTTPFYVPSYLGAIDGTKDFQHLSDSMMHIGPLRIRKVDHEPYTVTVPDVDWCLRFDGFATVYIPEESEFRVPLGTQIAVMNNSDQRVVIKGVGEVVIGGTDYPMINKWKVGVLVKYNANFWLLSLGSGAAGGPATPGAPTLLTASGAGNIVSVSWKAPTDDGGSPITGYGTEYSKDGKVWVDGPKTDAKTFSTKIAPAGPGEWSFRVKAESEAGYGEVSNVLKATTTMDAPTLVHAAYGVWKITNFVAAYTYKVTCNTGTASVDGDGNIRPAAGNADMSVLATFETATSGSLAFARRPEGSHQETITDCNTCGTVECNCHDDWGSCGCECGGGGCGCYPSPNAQSFQQCGCPATMCWYNPVRKCDTCCRSCEINVPDNYGPQGFSHEYSEWSKIG